VPELGLLADHAGLRIEVLRAPNKAPPPEKDPPKGWVTPAKRAIEPTSAVGPRRITPAGRSNPTPDTSNAQH